LVKNSNILPFTIDIIDSIKTVDGFANANLLRLKARAHNLLAAIIS
jgi:hypothetical protein